MSELTETYGCIQKDTIINLSDRKLTIEDLWNEYHLDIMIDDDYPDVEFSIPNSELKVLVFDGTDFINQKVNRIIKFNISNLFILI